MPLNTYPWFKLNPQDILQSPHYVSLKDGDLGLLLRLLCLCWIHEGIPDDPDFLKRALGRNRLSKKVKLLQRNWIKRDGKLFDPDLEEQLKQKRSRSEQASAAANSKQINKTDERPRSDKSEKEIKITKEQIQRADGDRKVPQLLGKRQFELTSVNAMLPKFSLSLSISNSLEKATKRKMTPPQPDEAIVSSLTEECVRQEISAEEFDRKLSVFMDRKRRTNSSWNPDGWGFFKVVFLPELNGKNEEVRRRYSQSPAAECASA